MKKLLMAVTILLSLLFCTSVMAKSDDMIKISMNGEVKAAKDINQGKGISFTLPDLETNKFLISAIELAIFEKKEMEYSIFGESKMINEPTSLNISVDFGDISRFAEKARYKIAYRYYVKSLDDMSKIIIAGKNIKDGWRLVGEVNNQAPSENGFVFYKNSLPTVEVTEISFYGETINGLQTITYTPEQLKTMFLPKDALKKGVTIHYNAKDFDEEDTVTVGYKLIDAIENTIVGEGILPSDNRILSDCESNYVSIVLCASDNWSEPSESFPINIMLDKELPQVLTEFKDMGRVLKGRNIYSKFTIIDDQNNALTGGNVFYSIKKDGVFLYNNIRIANNQKGEYIVDRTNMVDGIYEINLTIFDKAYNKSTHTLIQTLDNTAPRVTFKSQSENSEATLYSTWMNESKKIIFTATDAYAGVKKSNCYLNFGYLGSMSVQDAAKEHTFSYQVTNIKTGKLYYYFYVYDNAVTINKTINSVNLSSSGNSVFVSKYVWLDKTPPSISINADENKWHEAPVAIFSEIYDYSSAVNVADNSGVKSKFYEVTQTELPLGNWKTYSNGVVFETGGVFYLHIKAIDYAENESVETKKIKVNTKAHITSEIEPTEDSMHTIYNKKTGIYIIKNTAYATKYHFTLQDRDLNDSIKTDIVLVSNDNNKIFSKVLVETPPSGAESREVIFNLPYTKQDGNPLPDGVYTMGITLSEVKNDETTLVTVVKNMACEVVIKRNSPPTPIISADGGKVSIEYPIETLAGSFNRNDIKAMYKREYKAVKEGVPVTNVYKTYSGSFDTDDIVVTALYTDPAGNISTASKRIFKEPSGDDVPGSIITDGNTVTVEESRNANVYYIGTRRDKQSGIDEKCFGFVN